MIYSKHSYSKVYDTLVQSIIILNGLTDIGYMLYTSATNDTLFLQLYNLEQQKYKYAGKNFTMLPHKLNNTFDFPNSILRPAMDTSRISASSG